MNLQKVWDKAQSGWQASQSRTPGQTGKDPGILTVGSLRVKVIQDVVELQSEGKEERSTTREHFSKSVIF